MRVFAIAASVTPLYPRCLVTINDAGGIEMGTSTADGSMIETQGGKHVFTTTRMVRTFLGVLTTALVVGCGGGGNPTGPSPSSPTVTACTDLMNCSTGNVKGVFIIVYAGNLPNGTDASFMYTFAGITISGTSGAGRKTSQFVGLAPGDYELVGQAGNHITFEFSNSRGFGPRAVQVLEGTVSSRSCASVTLGATGDIPQNFRLKLTLADVDTTVCLN